MNLEELRLSREISSLAKIAFGSKQIVPVGNENVSFVSSTHCFGYVLPCFRTIIVMFQNQDLQAKTPFVFLLKRMHHMVCLFIQNSTLSLRCVLRNGQVMFNKYFPAGFVIEKPWPFLDTVSYVNDISPPVLLFKITYFVSSVYQDVKRNRLCLMKSCYHFCC